MPTKKIFPILLGTAMLLAGCGQHTGTFEYMESFFAMDTRMNFTAYGNYAEEAVQEARDSIGELETMWSVTDENSEIYAVNHSGGEPVSISAETEELLQFTLKIAEQTEGALDPTIYPILSAWGFTKEENRIPSAGEIKELLRTVGYERIQLEDHSVRIEADMMLDLGAAGKGYAGDLAAEIIKEAGISSALLDIGGNIQAVGSRPDGTDWRLGIRSPFGEGTLGILQVSDKVVVTSGNYERYFVGEDGNTYGHIINPATGYPVENELASVTVIASEGKYGDALSTSLFVMGLEDAARHWQVHQDFEMLLITEQGEIYLTEGIEKAFSLDSSYEQMKINVVKNEI